MAKTAAKSKPGQAKSDSNKSTGKTKKEVFSVEREIGVDERQESFAIKVDFNRVNGNIAITGKLTTLKFSHTNESETDKVLDQWLEMWKEAINGALEKRREWTEEPETNVTQLAFKW